MVAVHTGHVQQILHTLFVEATLAAIKNRQGKTRQRENTRRPKKRGAGARFSQGNREI